MDVVLDLYNFDSTDAIGSRYVLTSPRSLEACSRLKIKPVQLLPKTHQDFANENIGKSTEFIQILYNDWEEKRIAKLQRCRQEREKVIMQHRISQKKEAKCQANSHRKKLHNDSFKKNESSSSTVNSTCNTSKNSGDFKKKPQNNANKPRLTKSVFEAMPIINTEEPSRSNTPVNTADPQQVDESSLSLSLLRTDRSRNLTDQTDRLRSKSVETENRQGKKKVHTVRSSSVFGDYSNVASGYTTPQIQRDRRLVELMKERRKQDEKMEKERCKKIVSWSMEKKKDEEAKRKEAVQRQKELANHQLEWERKLLEAERKKKLLLREEEKEKERQQEQFEAIIKLNKEKQERARLQQIEARKKLALEKKQFQEKSLDILNQEVLTFQRAIEKEIATKQERATRLKLEKEMKELEKVKLMNKRQNERLAEIQSEIKQKEREEEKLRKDALEEKLKKADENYTKKILDRDLTMKQQGQQINQKIQQTRENQKRIEQEIEEYKQSIIEQTNERLQRATDVALKNTQNKSFRAQKIRKAEELGWKKKLHRIQEEDEENMKRTVENIELKESKVKRHLQLKEAAFEFSRVQAKINEAEREAVKRKSSNFSEMVRKAQLTANIGRGPRSSFVNYSTVKLG